MRNGRDTKLECPRCRLVATRRGGRQAHCAYCGAEPVPASGPSEDWIRAYLYGDGEADPRLRPLDQVPMTREVADRLGAPLEVFGVRRLAHPEMPEIGFGAVAEDGARVVGPEAAQLVGLEGGELERRWTSTGTAGRSRTSTGAPSSSSTSASRRP